MACAPSLPTSTRCASPTRTPAAAYSDFCATRADIEVKLQAADLCPDCRAGVEQAGLPLERFLRLAETLRSLATDPPTAIQ